MKRTETVIDPSGYPEAIRPFLLGARIYDSSCSREARVLYLACDDGYYLKTAPKGTLQKEAEISTFIMYKPTVDMGVVDNGDSVIGNIDPVSLKQKIRIDYDKSGNIFEQIANFFWSLFTVTIPNIIANFVIWLTLEASCVPMQSSTSPRARISSSTRRCRLRLIPTI